MQSLTLYAHVGKDGILKLETPIGVANTDLEVILIVNPVSQTRPALEWPANFFTEIIGGWEGNPLIRESQGRYEARNELK